MNGVFLRAKDFLTSGTLERDLLRYRPDCIILEVDDPREMRSFSKLERQPVFPMIAIGHQSPELLANMFMQALEVLNTRTIYVKTSQKSNTKARKYIWEFLELLKDRLPCIYVTAPASHFFETDTCASNLMEYSNELGFDIHPCFMLTNSPESMEILDHKRFRDVLDHDPLSEMAVQILLSDNMDMPFLSISANVHFIGMGSFIWFRGDLMDVNIIAYARVTHDRTSAWEDPELRSRTTRKFYVGQPDIEIVEILPGGVGKTTEGDYIYLKNFSIEML